MSPMSYVIPKLLLQDAFIAFDAQPGAISTTAFNRNGNILAYAVSYDWSKGHSGMTPGMPNKILLHSCKDEEVRKRAARK
jgi:mRNA export factor